MASITSEQGIIRSEVIVLKWQTIRFRGYWIRYRLEPQIIRVDNQGIYHLGKVLFPRPNRVSYEMALLLKEKYERRYKRPLYIKTSSIATEIWGHTHLDIYYRALLRLPIPTRLRQRYTNRLESTKIIDIGVRAVDQNRIVWDIGDYVGGWFVFWLIRRRMR
ncbi:hypothetical protein [Exiguobacterium acetylicum]|uniref:hypothetical protein n=1 Tax=Exiguobacterium acetylicum TaxID=41170 RepID=UPI00301B5CE8